jgi:hypothetical protein
VSLAEPPWYIGAWRCRSICVPGGEPTEPCEAWWLQTERSFIDIRVTRDGHADNGLPYSSTRAFAGRFEIADGETRWHLELDTHGRTPSTDTALASGLYIDTGDGDGDVMIEDAPGRFREEWVRHTPIGDIEIVHANSMIAIRINEISAVVWKSAAHTSGHLWLPGLMGEFKASSVPDPPP